MLGAMSELCPPVHPTFIARDLVGACPMTAAQFASDSTMIPQEKFATDKSEDKIFVNSRYLRNPRDNRLFRLDLQPAASSMPGFYHCGFGTH
jgi:hypothetical protein